MDKKKMGTSKSTQDMNRAKAAKMLGGAPAKSSADMMAMKMPIKKSGMMPMKKAMGGAAKASVRKGKC